MASAISSLSSSNLQTALVQAQRKVQTDQNQVQQDNAQLARSQAQLSSSRDELSSTQQQSRAAQAAPVTATPAVRLDSAISAPVTSQTPLPAALANSRPQVNTSGQTIGGLINVSA